MSTYRVKLDVFAGPLDLLLYLVRKEEVDIYDIPITRVTDQYIRYIDMLNGLDIEIAGEFLVMAATLMQIKSAMLLPKASPEDEDDEEAIDPRSELIKQLLQYKKFKDAANLLDAASCQQAEKFSRPDSILKNIEPEKEPELDMDQVSIWTLLEAFDAVMAATGQGYYQDYSTIKDDTPIDRHQVNILKRLQSTGPMTFQRVFEGTKNKMTLVGMFLAMLELVRNKLIWLEQPEDSESIFVKAITDDPADHAVKNAIIATEEEELLKEQQAKEMAEGQEITVTEESPHKQTDSPLQSDPDHQNRHQTEKSPQNEKPQNPPIPIVELPSASRTKPQNKVKFKDS